MQSFSDASLRNFGDFGGVRSIGGVNDVELKTSVLGNRRDGVVGSIVSVMLLFETERKQAFGYPGGVSGSKPNGRCGLAPFKSE